MRRGLGLLTLGSSAVALGLVLTPPDRELEAPVATPAPLVVPGETLARSKVLVSAAPVLPAGRDAFRDPLAHAQLPAVAAEIATTVPYPPGAGESMDWASVPSDPQDMGTISFRGDVQFLVEYRAACTWLAFWLFAQERGEPAALADATAVLQDVPHWPSLRGALEDAHERTVGWPLMARASAAGEAAPLRQYARGNCARVPSPYAAAIR